MPPKKDDKLKCYTLRAKSDGHKYVTCDDNKKAPVKKVKLKLKLKPKKSVEGQRPPPPRPPPPTPTAKDLADEALRAVKKAMAVAGKPKLKQQLIDRLEPVINEKAPVKKVKLKLKLKPKPVVKKELPDDVLKQISAFSKPSFMINAEKAYKEIGEARKKVRFGTQIYYKSGQKKGKPKFFQTTPQDMEDEERWEKEIELKMAKKYSLPKDWDIKYRTNGGDESSFILPSRNEIANTLSMWVGTNADAKNPYR